MPKNPMPIILGAFVLVAVVIVVLLTRGGDDEGPEPDATGGPDIELVEDAPTDSTPDGDEGEAGDDISAETRQAQFDAASDYVMAYHQYSFRDPSPNEWLKRVRPTITDDHWHVLDDLFGGADDDLSNAWDEIRSERSVVTVNVHEVLYDPWYDPSADESVVAVNYTMSTDNAIGTGGTGPEQTKRLLVTKVGDTFLVADDLQEGQ